MAYTTLITAFFFLAAQVGHISCGAMSSYYQYNRAYSSFARGFPIVKSGDEIALRWASTSYVTWLACSHGTSCKRNTCPGRYMTKSKWHSCPRVSFRILGWNKKQGEPINSGDTIVLSPVFERHTRWRQGYEYYMYCISQCTRYTAQNLMTTKNKFFQHLHLHFQLFSRQAVDGSPVQHGDIVGLKNPYHCNSCYVYRNSNTYFYSGSCSTNKFNCVYEGSSRGFQIYKMML